VVRHGGRSGMTCLAGEHRGHERDESSTRGGHSSENICACKQASSDS
jgi:hypothetical protein